MPNPISPENHIFFSIREIYEMSNWELFCSIAGVDPLSVQGPITAENIVNILNRIEIRSGNQVRGHERFINDLNTEGNNLRNVFDRYLNDMRNDMEGGNFSFHTTDGRTLLLDPEGGFNGLSQDFVNRFNANAMSTYYNYIVRQPVRDAAALSDITSEALRASKAHKYYNPVQRGVYVVFADDPGVFNEADMEDDELDTPTGPAPMGPAPAGPAPAEPEPAPARRVFESTHSRWMEAGIDRFDLENATKKPPREDANGERKRKLKFLADLTGAALDENSTYEDCKTALESIIVNGRSAYDYFDLENKPKNIETITGNLVPQLTETIDNSFSIKPHKLDFIFIKKPGKDAVPLKLSPPDVYVPQSLEDTRDKLLSVKEVQDYVYQSYLLRSPDTGGNEEYSRENENSRDFRELKGQNEFNYARSLRFEDIVNIDIGGIATYRTRLAAKSNAQIMEDYDKYLAPVLAACKAQPDYNKQVLEAFHNYLVWDEPEDKIYFPQNSPEYSTRPREKLLSIDNETNDKRYVKAENKVLLDYVRKYQIHIPAAENGAEPEPVECLLALQDEIADRARAMSREELKRDSSNKSIDEKVNDILSTNLANYNKYQDSKLNATINDKYNKQADTYARKLNNESVNRRDERDLQYHANIMPPKFSLRLDEIGDPESLMKTIRNRSADIDNIMVDGKSIKSLLTQILPPNIHDISQMSDTDCKLISRSGAFRKEIFEKFDKMIHPDMYTHRDNEPIMPVITLKTDVGEIAPTITSGNEIDPLPKVEPMSGFMRRFSKPNTIAANEKAVKEYEASVKRMEIRHKDNLSKEAITEAIRINTKFSSGKALTPEERAFAASRNINYPNPDVHPASLNTLQQRTATTPRNLPLTQPTNTNENSNSMNSPQNGMGASN